ncbi:MAG: FtsQ-type POTRA domain-containing protein [Clostridia bacterium]|nr:FtsQ-type POTRA domain-containing protein [Clostridia bacterium]
MDRKNQTENDILGNSSSRFSQEERARMTAENAGRRKFSQREKIKRPVNTSARHQNSIADKPQAVKGKEKTSYEKVGGSRNERVRTSTAQRKKEKKRQNNLVICMLFVVVIALIGVLTTIVLKINTIEVIGTESYSSQTVLTAAGLNSGDSMVLINTKAVEEKIETELPYIEKAEIKRVWPDKIVISLEDAIPALAIDTGKGYIFLNNSCKVLDDDAIALNSNAAVIKGLSVEEAQPGKTIVFKGDINTSDFTTLTKALEESEIVGISSYDLSSISSIVVVIDHRIEVRLGTLAGAAEKFAFGKKVIEETVASDKKHAMLIDITDDGKAYVRAKNDNSVNFSEQPVTEVETDPESTTAENESTTSLSVG